MSLYKENMLNKIEDDLQGRNQNWDELEAHLAENASKHITESGENENGRYIKFDDGTLICTRQVTADFSLLYQNFTLPASPVGYMSASFSIDSSTSSASIVRSRSETFIRVVGGNWRFFSSGASDEPSVPLVLFAFGRWK